MSNGEGGLQNLSLKSQKKVTQKTGRGEKGLGKKKEDFSAKKKRKNTRKEETVCTLFREGGVKKGVLGRVREREREEKIRESLGRIHKV